MSQEKWYLHVHYKNTLHSRLLCTLSWSTWRSELLNFSSMDSDSDNMEVMTSKRRAYISLPQKYLADFAENYDLDHGLVVRDLNPYVNESYVRAYFRKWGTVTSCKVKRSPISGEDKAVAYVRFATKDEVDRAEWAGPHYIGGIVEVTQVVSPKIEEDSDEEVAAAASWP
ncbi:uncharacterized protein LOC126405517 [Epinephelus moara]|uniref:uncharacterized protein LOC126405517 n=1 Tax=Epinephelus moara TaxID=300413 RepID=UPI00214ED1C5|nr:uncharacterized protein LOC126405517 [Epinephelus moara]